METPWDSVIVASNRGPVEYHRRTDGQLRATRGSGGVVTALAAIAARMPLTWIAAPITDADRAVAGGESAPQTSFPQRFVQIDRTTYRRYYERFANGLLWFLQHYMQDTAYEPRIDTRMHRAWTQGYVPANHAFGEAVLNAADPNGRPLVLIQDYQLYLVPSVVREGHANAIVSHFTHIPWPEPRYWQLIPAAMRDAICRGLLGADLLGFQTRRDARQFLECCQTFLPEATVDRAAGEVTLDGRSTRLRNYPISIDVERVRRLAASADVTRHRQRLSELAGEQTIVRVDRMEPSKNVARGFEALDLLLRERPDLVGRVRMLAFLVPSREAVPAYRRYREEVVAQVDEINRRYARGGWTPITMFYENNYAQALAGLSLYDVLLVNPVIDGMNLVAKEGPIVNRRDGVLILSEGAGAHEQLGEWALSVAAADVVGTRQALEEALTMPPAERGRRHAALRDAVSREDVHWWLDRQLADLTALASA